MSQTKEREHISINEEQWDDYTSQDQWEQDGEIYNFVEDNLTNGDGEWHQVICQRESDKKFFKFSWGLTWSQAYRCGDCLTEVFPKTVTTTTYE